MARKSARCIAIEDQAPALLREHGRPMATSQIAERVGMWEYDSRCWRILRELELEGRLTCRRDPAMRRVYWAIAGPTDPPPGPLIHYGRRPRDDSLYHPVVFNLCGEPLIALGSSRIGPARKDVDTAAAASAGHERVAVVVPFSPVIV